MFRKNTKKDENSICEFHPSVLLTKNYLRMKTKMMIITLFMVFGISLSAFSQEKTIVMKCNVDCNGCKTEIEKNMAFEKGVKSVDASVETKEVTIVYNEKKTNAQTLSEALKKVGYTNEIVSEQKCEPGCKKECCAKKGEGDKNCQKKCPSKTATE